MGVEAVVWFLCVYAHIGDGGGRGIFQYVFAVCMGKRGVGMNVAQVLCLVRNENGIFYVC